MTENVTSLNCFTALRNIFKGLRQNVKLFIISSKLLENIIFLEKNMSKFPIEKLTQHQFYLAYF